MHLSSSETRLCFGGFFGSSRNLGGKAAWGRVCGRAKLLAGTLRCLHLCWRLPWDWSDEEQLGRCPKPQQGRCPCTLQGTASLDPFSRLSWSRFHAPSACSFLVLRRSPCLPQRFYEEPFCELAASVLEELHRHVSAAEGYPHADFRLLRLHNLRAGAR